MTATFTDPESKRPQIVRGRYQIVPADGTKPKAMTRCTTFVKALDDGYGLQKWERRVAARGLVERPDLFAMFASADADDKDALDSILDDAREAGKGNAGANHGTALHKWTDDLDAGLPVTIPAPWDADVAAYQSALTDAGIIHVPGMAERTIVQPDLNVAGRFDRLSMLPGRPLPVVADLKTGQDLTYSWGAIAMQLAIYANAATIYDWDTETHEPMPPVDRDVALVIHLPVGAATCHLYEVDIAKGWEMVQVAARVRAWRSEARKVATPYTPPTAPTVVALAPLATPAPPRPVGALEEAARADRITHLRGRLSVLIDIPGAADIVNQQRGALPTFREEADTPGLLTAHDLDRWADIIATVEGQVQAPFASDHDPAGRLPANDPRITALRTRLARLPSDLIERVRVDAEQAGAPKLSSGEATVAHLDIVAGIIDTAEHEADERTVKAWQHLAVFPSYLLANAIRHADCESGDVTADRLQRLADLADAFLGNFIDDDEEGELGPTRGALHRLVEQFGGKAQLLAAARQAADDLGIDKPRASTDVLTSTPLVARLAVTDA